MKRYAHAAAISLVLSLLAPLSAQSEERPSPLQLLNLKDLAGACYVHLSYAGLQVIYESEDDDKTLTENVTPLFIEATFWQQVMGGTSAQAAEHWGAGVIDQDMEAKLPQVAYCAAQARLGLELLTADKLGATAVVGSAQALRAMHLRLPPPP